MLHPPRLELATSNNLDL